MKQHLQISGMLLFVAGFISLMGIITAEIYYPSGYTTALSEISDLGSTRPPHIVIYQPSATIFNSSMIAAGTLSLAAALLLFVAKQYKLIACFLFIFGIGVAGVGFFPGNTSPHPWLSLLTFVSGGLGALASSLRLRGPFRFISFILGACSLMFLFFASRFIPHLGDGGTERWVAYPIIFWLTGLGGYLMGTPSLTIKSKL